MLDHKAYRGIDSLGRAVYSTFISSWSHIGQLSTPNEPFVLFIGADAAHVASESLLDAAKGLIAQRVVYVVAWGPDCERMEEAFDWASAIAQVDDSNAPHIMTTSHATETLSDALSFATNLAVPAGEFEDACKTLVAVFVGNVNWYNEAENEFEDVLRD